jgi:hypothetical protein
LAILTLQRRLREAGRIRIGAQVPQNGKRRPAKLDAFRLTSSDRTAIEAAAELYGGKPHHWEAAPVGVVWELFTEATWLPVVVPPAASAFSQFMESWSGGGCVRRCDGIVELLSDSSCLCETEAKPQCKPTTRLSVILRDLPGLGVWRLESHGYYAATELAGTVEVCVQAATRGQLLPAVLRLEQRQVKRAGEPTRNFAVPVLDIQVKPEQLGLVVGTGAPAELPAGPSWQPIPTELDPAPVADLGDAIRSAGTDGPRRTKRSAPELPPTGVNPRGVADEAPPPPPPDDEPAATITPAQMRNVQALYTSLDVKSAAERQRVATVLLGVPIMSHKDLTIDQASTLIERLKAIEAGFMEFVIDENGDVVGVRDTSPETAPTEERP